MKKYTHFTSSLSGKELAVCVAVLAVIALLTYAAYADAKWWAKYKVENHCRRSGQVRHTPTTHFIHGGNGQITGSYVTMQTDYEWVCDGDKRYWR